MRVLITGASGFVGSHLAVALSGLHDVLGVVGTNPLEPPIPTVRCDLTRREDANRVLDDFQPEAVVHCAALSRVLMCEDQQSLAWNVNYEATQWLAEWSARHAARMIFLSSDQVFSGERGAYIESDEPSPMNEYGRTKLAAEGVVTGASTRNVVVRCNSVVGQSLGWGESFTESVTKATRVRVPMTLYADQFRSPIHVRSLIRLLAWLCGETGLTGILHAGGPERLNRVETAEIALRAYGLDSSVCERGSYRSHPRWKIMPQDTSYGAGKILSLPAAIIPRSLVEEFHEEANRSRPFA